MSQALLMNRLSRWGIDERLALWLFLCMAGYAWVSMVQCGRPAPFIDRAGSYTQFLRLMALAPVLYWVGPRHVLRAWGEGGAAALRWNGLLYVLPFFIGLQFFYLQRIDAINYSLNYHDLTRMGPVAIAVFSAVALLIVVLAWFHLRWARQAGILAPYIGAFVGSIAGIAQVTVLLNETRHLHIHHWFLFCFFVPFARFRNPVSTICQAVCAAIAVEGVAEWSMSTIWELNK
jgi:hypothetical protein